MKITRASNRQLKSWRKLQQKKHRQESGLFLAEGLRCVEQILQNTSLEVAALIRSESSGWSPSQDLISESAAKSKTGVAVYETDDGTFGSLVDTETPQGVAAVCRLPVERPAETLSDLPSPLIVVDAVQDPGNLGTMIRTGVWFGAGGLLCGSGTVDPYHPKVVRSTAGATGILPVASGELHLLLDLLEENGWKIILLDAGPDSVSLAEHGPAMGVGGSGKTVLVAGSEAHGVDPKLKKKGRTAVRIEGKSGSVESLNVSIALGIALYECAGRMF